MRLYIHGTYGRCLSERNPWRMQPEESVRTRGNVTRALLRTQQPAKVWLWHVSLTKRLTCSSTCVREKSLTCGSSTVPMLVGMQQVCVGKEGRRRLSGCPQARKYAGGREIIQYQQRHLGLLHCFWMPIPRFGPYLYAPSLARWRKEGRREGSNHSARPGSHGWARAHEPKQSASGWREGEAPFPAVCCDWKSLSSFSPPPGQQKGEPFSPHGHRGGRFPLLALGFCSLAPCGSKMPLPDPVLALTVAGRWTVKGGGISRALCEISLPLALALALAHRTPSQCSCSACGGGCCAGVLALRDNDTSRSEEDGGGQAVVEGNWQSSSSQAKAASLFGHPIVPCGFVSDSAPYAPLLPPSNCSR